MQLKIAAVLIAGVCIQLAAAQTIPEAAAAAAAASRTAAATASRTAAAAASPAPAPTSPCYQLPVSFYPTSTTVDYGALSSPSVWTPAGQNMAGNTDPEIVEKAVIYLSEGLVPTLHFSPRHFLLRQGAAVPAACQYDTGVPDLPALPPATAPPRSTPAPGLTDLLEEAKALFEPANKRRLQASPTSDPEHTPSPSSTSPTSDTAVVPAAAAHRRQLLGAQTVIKAAAYQVTYSVNGSIPLVASPVADDLKGQDPVVVLQPILQGLEDGDYCMEVNVSIPAGSATILDSASQSEISAPSQLLFNTKTVCFHLQNKPPAAASISLSTCGENVTVKVTGITPLPVLATNNASWLLLRPILRVSGQLATGLEELAGASPPAGTAAAAKLVDAPSPNTAFDRFVAIPSVGDPAVTPGMDGSEGELEVTLPASQWYKEGIWSVSAELSLTGETPALITLPKNGSYAAGQLTQGADVIGMPRYLATQVMDGVKVGIQRGKVPVYLRRLELPATLQVGQPANFAWQYSGAAGTTTCTYGGVPMVNTPQGDACQSPLTISPTELASEPVFNITFTDACGFNRTDSFKLTASKGVITQSKVDDPVALKGLVGVGSVSVTASSAQGWASTSLALQPLLSAIAAAFLAGWL